MLTTLPATVVNNVTKGHGAAIESTSLAAAAIISAAFCHDIRHIAGLCGRPIRACYRLQRLRLRGRALPRREMTEKMASATTVIAVSGDIVTITAEWYYDGDVG